MSLQTLIQTIKDADPLALYGAVVGTLALGLNFLRYRVTVSRGRRKLKVSAMEHPNAQANLDEIVNADFMKQFSVLGPIYTVTVTNPGHVSVHLQDAGLIAGKNRSQQKRQAALKNGGNPRHLRDIAGLGGVELSPGQKETFDIYLRVGEDLPHFAKAYVESHEGKTWLGSVKSKSKLKVHPVPSQEIPSDDLNIPNKHSKL